MNFIIYILTSISTPAGKFRFVIASTILGVGFKISKRRRWTRISNCSLAFLWTKEDRFTVYFFISVGKGTGPASSAPYLKAVSTICLMEASKILWSYALTRILSFCFSSTSLGLAFAISKLLHNLCYNSGSYGLSALSYGKALFLFQCHWRDKFYDKFNRVSGHYHLCSLRQSNLARDICRPNVELRLVSGKERGMPSAFLFGQNINFGVKVRVRGNRRRF